LALILDKGSPRCTWFAPLIAKARAVSEDRKPLSNSRFCELQSTLDTLESGFNPIDAIGHGGILLLEDADPSFDLAQIVGNSIKLLVELAE
jgi:hypothetical protein